MDAQQRNNSETTLHEAPQPASHWHLLSPRGVVTSDILDASYEGSGTENSPYLINFIDRDPGDPKQYPSWKKWSIVATVSFTTFIASLGSSIYLGTITEVEEQFSINEEVAILGLSLYVLGLVVGPLFWAPLGELYGRQTTFCVSFAGSTIFNGGSVASQNIQTLLILRFFAGTFASCPFTNSNGNLADIFEPAQRGLAFGFYAGTPFMGMYHALSVLPSYLTKIYRPNSWSRHWWISRYSSRMALGSRSPHYPVSCQSRHGHPSPS